MAGKILVIGATGTLGTQLLKELGQKGERPKGASRDPVKASSRVGDIADFVEFDFERPRTFSAALSGVERVFLIARPGDEQADRVAKPFIDEMKHSGVRRVVNMTAMGVEKRDDVALRKVERALEDSGLGFTHLRPNWFMQVFTAGALHADICLTGGIHVPAADATVSYIDVRDIASVATVALTEKGHEGKAYTLTGGRALSHDEIARAISLAIGREIQYVSINDELARKSMEKAGFPPVRVERLLGFYRLVRGGFCAPVSADVEKILGRPPISIEQFAKDHASSWK